LEPTESTDARPFVAYGQTARHEHIIVMSLAIFVRRDVVRARKALKRARDAARVPATLHADGRNLFAHSAGTPVSLADAPVLLARTVDAINEVPGMVRYVWLDLKKSPDHIDPDDAGFRDHLRGILTEACFAVPPGGQYGPRAFECDVLAADRADREVFSTALLLDTADTLAHAFARVIAAPDQHAWIRKEVDRFTYWSNMEILARSENPA
jgi:hypothetical protein